MVAGTGVFIGAVDIIAHAKAWGNRLGSALGVEIRGLVLGLVT